MEKRIKKPRKNQVKKKEVKPQSVMKIHYRNLHGTTNTPWQNAFRRYGELSLGDTSSGGFPDEIDHLHLGGSCKGAASVRGNPITVNEIKKVQKSTGCSVSVFFGDAFPGRFQFHHNLLDAGIPKLRIYSASLYGTSMWRPEVTWVAHPTDEDIFRLVKHKKNSNILFVGSMTPYRESIITALHSAGIEVDIVNSKYGKDLVEVSENYSVSIGMFYEESLPRIKYFSERLPNALAMGLVHIEADFDLTGAFESNEIIQWRKVDDLVEKIKYYQSHLKEGRDIIALGRKVVLENWTFNKLAERFVS